jgi:glycosyltransferase involved in cell wall biosynthesis
MERPVIATRIPGCEDAVEDGGTGLLVPPLDARALAQAMLRLALDESLRLALGAAGRARVVQFFARERIWQALAETYERLTDRCESTKSR